jgi:hypothetical protein
MVATDSRYLQLLLELGIHGDRHQVRYGSASWKESRKGYMERQVSNI